MSRPLDWARDGADWPNRAASRFVTAGRLAWHVQEAGAGPAVLLLHGTGAATHSWRGLLPLLAAQARVIAPDLPGHGFTSLPRAGQAGIEGMARLVGELLDAFGAAPDLVVGHSAGAAILVRMALDRRIAPRAIVSLNGALLPFPGVGGLVFPALAKLLFLNPFAPRLLARMADDPRAVARLIKGTGSALEPRGIALYRRLLADPGHVRATVAMMARWDLAGLKRDLPRLAVPLVLVAAGNDLAVPPRVADEVARRVPHASVRHLPGLGHLAHEEDPDSVAALIAAL